MLQLRAMVKMRVVAHVMSVQALRCARHANKRKDYARRCAAARDTREVLDDAARRMASECALMCAQTHARGAPKILMRAPRPTIIH